jgi:hypothetical protein
VNAKEQHSGVDVDHRCFPKGSDFILSVFSWEPLRGCGKLNFYYQYVTMISNATTLLLSL